MLEAALFLATLNKVMVDYLVGPVKQRWPEADFWWLLYLALVTGFAVAWYAGVNVFEEIISSPLLGRILTSILVGGGSSLIHEVFESVTSLRSGDTFISAELEEIDSGTER